MKPSRSPAGWQGSELLTQVHLSQLEDWKASYRKLRRGEAFDFPVLGVGVCVHQKGDDEVAWRKKMAPVFVERALRNCLEG